MSEKARKMDLNPPSIDQDKLKAFIEEPEKKLVNPEPEVTPAPKAKPKSVSKVKGGKYPWEDAHPEIIKVFNLRLRLPDKLRAEHIVKNTIEYSSLHDFCMKAILDKIDKELKKYK